MENEIIGSTFHLMQNSSNWKVLVVDDSVTFHDSFSNLIETFKVVEILDNIELVHTFSAEETIELLQNDDPLNPEFAVIFLDIVMIYNDAGFRVIDFIRQSSKNYITNIIIITGQAGKKFDSPDKIVNEYNVNGFINKYNLNGEAVVTSLLSGIRMFELIKKLKSNIQTLNFTTAYLTNSVLNDIKFDFNEKDFDLFAQHCLKTISNKHNKQISDFEKGAMELLKTYSNVSNNITLRIINLAVIRSTTEQIIQADIEAIIAELEENRSSFQWVADEELLKRVYVFLCGDFKTNTIKFIDKNETSLDQFKTHFSGYKILPKINWLESEKDLLHLIFALDQEASFKFSVYSIKKSEIQELSLKTSNAHNVLPEHFRLKGKDLKASSVKTCNSTSVRIISLSDTKDVLDWNPENKNPNYELIKQMIETNCFEE